MAKKQKKSLGGTLANGGPVVFRSKEIDINNRMPRVCYAEGKEKEALELLEKLGIIEILKMKKK